MIPNFEKVVANINHSFNISHLTIDRFPSLRHFHPEVEILLVVQGSGTRYVGDSVESFGPGDLVMIGPNVSHEWCSDKNGEGMSEAVYIMFNTEIMGKDFWNLPESKIILKIIQQSERGIKLTGKTRDEVESLLLKMDASYGFSRIIILLEILEKIAFSEEYRYLASPVVQNSINERDFERLNKVYKFVITHLEQKITLDMAASMANLSVPAFCRYFKKRTNKSFVRFLTELRIGNACRILVNENYSVADVSCICGFNNVSHFIKEFKKTTNLTPLNYQKKFAE
jgi:AraC-like DNA-binding protein